MLLSELKDHPVMSLESANRIGRVAGAVIDPATRRVVALRLRKTSGDGDTLHWEDLTALGQDAVTVAGQRLVTSARGRAEALSGKEHELVGKRVLTSAGDEVGEVDDVDVDVESGSVTRLVTSEGDVDGARLVGCGSYAVVVRAEEPT